MHLLITIKLSFGLMILSINFIATQLQGDTIAIILKSILPVFLIQKWSSIVFVLSTRPINFFFGDISIVVFFVESRAACCSIIDNKLLSIGLCLVQQDVRKKIVITIIIIFLILRIFFCKDNIFYLTKYEFSLLLPTAGGVSRGGVRDASSSSAVRAAPERALLPRGHRIPHMACTPCYAP